MGQGQKNEERHHRIGLQHEPFEFFEQEMLEVEQKDCLKQIGCLEIAQWVGH